MPSKLMPLGCVPWPLAGVVSALEDDTTWIGGGGGGSFLGVGDALEVDATSVCVCVLVSRWGWVVLSKLMPPSLIAGHSV